MHHFIQSQRTEIDNIIRSILTSCIIKLSTILKELLSQFLRLSFQIFKDFFTAFIRPASASHLATRPFLSSVHQELSIWIFITQEILNVIWLKELISQVFGVELTREIRIRRHLRYLHRLVWPIASWYYSNTICTFAYSERRTYVFICNI